MTPVRGTARKALGERSSVAAAEARAGAAVVDMGERSYTRAQPRSTHCVSRCACVDEVRTRVHNRAP
jgi:hypothetical protein